MNCDELNTQLRELRGGYASFTSYGGLRALSLAVSLGKREFDIHCVECSYIAAPTSWGPVDIAWSAYGADIRLVDDNCGVKIICHIVGCVERTMDDEREGH